MLEVARFYKARPEEIGIGNWYEMRDTESERGSVSRLQQAIVEKKHSQLPKRSLNMKSLYFY